MFVKLYWTIVYERGEAEICFDWMIFLPTVSFQDEMCLYKGTDHLTAGPARGLDANEIHNLLVPFLLAAFESTLTSWFYWFIPHSLSDLKTPPHLLLILPPQNAKSTRTKLGDRKTVLCQRGEESLTHSDNEPMWNTLVQLWDVWCNITYINFLYWMYIKKNE